MKTSIATVCLSGSLEHKLHAAAEAGFDGVEIYEQDFVVQPYTPEKIRGLASRLGISLDLYQPFRDFEGVDVDQLARNLRRAEAKFRLMNRLGIRDILVCSNASRDVIRDDRVFVEQLRALGELAERYEVRVAYEFLAWSTHVRDLEHADRIVRAVDHPSVGHGLDSFHMLSGSDDLAPLSGLAPHSVFFVQLADAPRLELGVIEWSRHHRVFPGEGSFKLDEYLGRLIVGGYTGPVSLEIFNDIYRQTDAFRTATEGMRALKWLHERALTWIESREGSSEYVAPVRTYGPAWRIPASPAPTGINFVELRATDRRSIATTLGALGFVANGSHRSKSSVELWSQGSARVILNAPSQDTDALVVGALGFDVSEPLASSARALQLGANKVARDQEAEDEALQAVQAPDQVEIFFARSSRSRTPAWVQEFLGGSASDPVPEPLIHGVDHINLTQSWQHFGEAVLFFESILGLVADPVIEVPAPLGLVRSQVLRTRDGSVRLALNVVPDGYREEGLSLYAQHVAFASSDIIRLASIAVPRGLRVLEVPLNYYEDLEARFELEPDFVEKLRTWNILYDRDESGDFLHLYTEAVGQVFFEVVERRAGYDRYGEASSPVRLAAQHRQLQKASTW